MSRTQGQYWATHKPDRAWGAQRNIVNPAPAAGAEWLWHTPGWGAVAVLSVVVTFTASAQVANRNLAIEIQDGNSNTVAAFTSTMNIAAAAKPIVSFTRGAGTPQGVSAGIVTIALPEIMMGQAWSLGSKTGNLQTEDKWGPQRILLEEYEQDPHHEYAEFMAKMERLHRLAEELTRRGIA